MPKPWIAAALLAAWGIAAMAQEPKQETLRQRLEREAGSQWEAAHDKTRPKRAPAQAAQVKALFDKVQALTGLKTFEPANVAKALRIPDAFQVTERGDAFNIYEAKLSTGAIRRVEVRVGADSDRALAIVDVDPDLGIVPGELSDRFGDSFGIGGPSIHAPAGSPYYYVYQRKAGRLSLGIKPGPVHVFQYAVWDTIEKGP